jgi:pSer/pThr/pTyr-binding forkhead associated (FHA) protein
MNPIDSHHEHNGRSISLPSIRVKIEKGKADQREFCFDKPFQIGRSNECEVPILDDIVSRVHAKVDFSGNQWRVSDLNSGNGVWINGVKIDQATLKNNTRAELGQDGPALVFSMENPDATCLQPLSGQSSGPEDSRTLEQYEAHYFSNAPQDQIGDHTRMVRRAYQKVKTKQKRIYLGIISVIAAVCLAAGFYAIQKHLEIQKQKKLAEDIFYSMKSLEIELAKVLEEVRKSQDVRLQKNIDTYRDKLKEMEKSYNEFVSSLKIYEAAPDNEAALVLKTARTFGECEINIPDEFRQEVLKYIKKWKSTRRLEDAVRRAEQKGYAPRIIAAMKKYDLPPQFFYLALQESGFDVNACGPQTRFGIAKGAWQFIPSTAKDYGLKIGGLQHLRMPDAGDERHSFEKSTNCAARYIRDIFNTDAQASGLLVMASYNWGQGRVVDLIRKMPENPKERNFWLFLKKYKNKIPKETYDYVFYIFSAAVIGENPRLFGFDFDNPLNL